MLTIPDTDKSLVLIIFIISCLFLVIKETFIVENLANVYKSIKKK